MINYWSPVSGGKRMMRFIVEGVRTHGMCADNLDNTRRYNVQLRYGPVIWEEDAELYTQPLSVARNTVNFDLLPFFSLAVQERGLAKCASSFHRKMAQICGCCSVPHVRDTPQNKLCSISTSCAVRVPWAQHQVPHFWIQAGCFHLGTACPQSSICRLHTLLPVHKILHNK